MFVFAFTVKGFVRVADCLALAGITGQTGRAFIDRLAGLASRFIAHN